MAIKTSLKKFEKCEYFSSSAFETYRGYKIYFLVSGNATYQNANGVNLSLSSGGAILIPPYERHRFSGAVNHSFEIYFDGGDVDPSILSEVVECFSKAKIINFGNRRRAINLDCEKLNNEASAGKNYKSISVCAIFQNILIEIIRAVAKNKDNTQGNDGCAIMQVVEFVDKKYAEKITVEDMASIAHMSKSHFACQFKKYMGMTPNDYLNKVRISVAVKYVCVPSMTMLDVAKKVGMKSASYFCSQFKKYMNMSPRKYGELVNAKIVLYDFENDRKSNKGGQNGNIH